MLGYSVLLGLGLAVSAPWWLLRMATTRRYREGLRERLGRVPGRLRAAVAGHRVVWVHAVSVGEVLAVSRLVRELEATLNGTAAGGDPEKPWIVVLSTTTKTGQDLARERFGADRVFPFPLDFAWAVRAYLRVLRPAMLVLAESELWPRVLHECARSEVPVAVVNARVSDRSFGRALRVKALWVRMGRNVSLWLAQSDEDAQRLIQLGAQAERVRVSGNLKYDVRAPKGSRTVRLIEELAGERPVVLAGSTAGRISKKTLSEEEIVIQAWCGAARTDLHALLILAPRHPDRFDEVYAVASKYQCLRASEILPELADHRYAEIVVLDTIGDLAALYRVADVAFVGGSLVGKGGHNPLEPAQFGVPVLMGPSFENFRDVVRGMQAADAIRIVKDRDALENQLFALLRDGEAAHAMGERGLEAFDREQGATARTVAALTMLLQAKTSVEATQAVPA